MKYLQVIATIICILLAWIAVSLSDIVSDYRTSSRTQAVTVVGGEVKVSNDPGKPLWIWKPN